MREYKLLGELFGYLCLKNTNLNNLECINAAMLAPIAGASAAIAACHEEHIAIDDNYVAAIMAFSNVEEPASLPMQGAWQSGFVLGKAGKRTPAYALVLRAHRNEKKYTTRELAELLGVVHEQYQSWELGSRPIPQKYIAKVAQTLGCDVAELLKNEV